MLSPEAMMLREAEALYSTNEVVPLRLKNLNPTFLESIRRGLVDVEAGRVHSHEDEEKYWEQWFKEN